MAILCCAWLLSLLSGTAASLPATDVTLVAQVATNEGGTQHMSVARLDSNTAIQCFVDWSSGVGEGACNILLLQGEALQVFGSKHIFRSTDTSRVEHVQVAAFSESAAVVCYSDTGSSNDVLCQALTIDVTSGTIQDGDRHELNALALSVGQVPYLSVASLSASEGAACWSTTDAGYQDRAGVCNRLTLSGSNITVGDEFYFDRSSSVTDISVQAFSDSTAVLCYRSGTGGVCARLALGSQGEDFEMGDPQGFFETDEAFDGVATVTFGDGSGAVCYAGGTGHDYLGCKGMFVAESSLTLGAEEEVSGSPASWVTATSLENGAALVCYDAAEEAVKCNIIGVLDGTSLDTGPPSEVHGDSRDDMSVTVASLEPDSAVLCFTTAQPNGGSCLALTMPPATTSATSTSTASTATTTDTTDTTETETTTPYTTTESSTTISTGTTTTPVPTWEATAWRECSSTCGQGEQTRTVTCSAGGEGLCEAGSQDALLPESRQCQQYTECPYEWTCPMGPDAETGEGCGAQRAVVIAALVAAAVLVVALVGLCARRPRRSGAPGGPDEVPAAPAARGLPDDGSALGHAAFCAALEAMEEARASGSRREYPKRPGAPRGLDFLHPSGVVAGASLNSAALDRAEGKRARAFPWPFSPSSP